MLGLCNFYRRVKTELGLKNKMKKIIITSIILIHFSIANCQNSQNSFPFLKGSYLGQDEPGINAELFAPELVSIGQGVHGNIVFTADLMEAAWHPNYKVNGKSLIYLVRYKDGNWGEPIEFFPKEGCNYSDPFYSYDGSKLYYLSGQEAASGNAENERIYFVERKGDEWSEPKLLSTNLPAFHWQFSFDKENNLYFGGNSDGKKGEIFFSKYNNGNYSTPEKLSHGSKLRCVRIFSVYRT
jgi:hypothetical protein